MLSATVSLKITPEKLNRMLEESGQMLEYAALACEKEMKKSITSGSKTGNIYSSDNKIHISSAPGEAPASDTGHLVNSIKMKKNSKYSYEIDITAVYSVLLEFGGARIQARPFILPAFKNSVKKLNRYLLNLRKNA